MNAPIAVDQGFLRGWVRAPGPDDHKYSRGVLGIVTGSALYPGAALIGVEAAVRTGVGMIRYVGPSALAQMVVTQHPEVVVAPGSVDALVVGSGMASPVEPEDEERIVDAAGHSVPSVVDAGALVHAEKFGPLSVLTPHRGELRALGERLGIDLGASDLETARNIAAHLGVAIVVKGSQGAVVNHLGDVWELPRATPWLATAGTGDALAGIIGAVCASWHERLRDTPALIAEAAAAGALIHSIAAARASARAVGDTDSPTGGPFSVMDVCREIPAVIGETLSSRG
jgi:ADP-dependent NAD(P)H-hydrate dehydratase / NAD(P)H-hydrate epimerase